MTASTSVKVLSVYEEDNRPADAHFSLSSGAIKDDYELEYDWDGDRKVSWTLTKGDMLTAMDGVYELDDPMVMARPPSTTDSRSTSRSR